MATQVLVEIANQTQRPPRYPKEIKVRYYFSAKELYDNNCKLDDITIRPDYDAMKSATNGEYEVQYDIVEYGDDGECYLELTWSDYQFYGSLQCQFALMDPVQNDKFTFIWDPTNDYSRSELKTAEELGVSLNVAPYLYDKITMYVDGEQVWGVAPDGSKPSDVKNQPATTTKQADTTTKTSTTSTKSNEPEAKAANFGDVNCDDSVDVSDVVLLNRFFVEDKKAKITDQGMLNADCKYDNSVDPDDATLILQYIARMIPYSQLGQK